MAEATEHFDVLIVGAGLSGIGAGYHLRTKCPRKSFVILEGRDTIGGTWDLFRYPGVRSDSDMFTLGYSFKPWTEAKAIADGSHILNYIREAATENGIDKKIRFRHCVKRAAWSSPDARWTIEAERSTGEGRSETVRFTCHFLFMCSGYYNYENGYDPEFPGAKDFAGPIVHPQKWTDDVDYANKRVVVIGSGATAVTLVPELAKKASHVTMLQRSPTYVAARPGRDPFADRMRARLPAKAAYQLIRWRNVLRGMFFFQLARRRPEKMKQLILGGVRAALGRVSPHACARRPHVRRAACRVDGVSERGGASGVDRTRHGPRDRRERTRRHDRPAFDFSHHRRAVVAPCDRRDGRHGESP